MSQTRVAALLVALTAVTLATGCAKRITEVDSSYTTVEGTADGSARLMLWADTPVPVTTWSDVGNPPGPSQDDVIVGVEQRYLHGPGSVHSMLIDGSPANGFQVMRRAQNGGFEQLRDFVVQPTRKWIDTQYEAYRIVDPTPSGFAPASYIARGLVAGAVTDASPLSNEAQLTQPSVPASVLFTAPVFTRGDSLIQLAWSPVAGAAGYWLHVYQYRPDATNEDRLAAAAPRPVFDGPVRDHLIAFVDAATTSYRMGVSTDGIVLAYEPALIGRQYEVRITAVAANGELLAYTAGSTRTVLVSDEIYLQFPSGAVSVDTSRPLSL